MRQAYIYLRSVTFFVGIKVIIFSDSQALYGEKMKKPFGWGGKLSTIFPLLFYAMALF